jgi:hypothetical protein
VSRAGIPSKLGHVLAGCLFFLLAIAWTFPLILHLSSSISGFAGDNLSFLWNSWWAREFVRRRAASVFLTDRLFAPFGIDLVQNTHTVLPALASATVFGTFPLVTAHNLTVLASLTANGVCAYALAFDRLRDRTAAIIAGLLFAGSPYLAIHALGHVNLINAWGIPLFALAFIRALERDSWVAATLTGIVAAAIAYTDYYYLVYCAALSVLLIGFETTTWQFRTRPSQLSGALRTSLLILLAADVASIVFILLSGGFDIEMGSVKLMARSTTNLLTAGWILVAIYAFARARPSVHVDVDRIALTRCVKKFFVTWGIALEGVSPIAGHAWSLWKAGDYVSPQASWRSGPGGVDLATLVLGNPLNPVTGGVTRGLYSRFGVDMMEESAWLGVAPLVLLWSARRFLMQDRESRRWIWVAVLFFIFSLGPWLHVGGFNTGLVLPQNLLARVPVISNARIPGRAIVVVMLALSLACGAALAALSGSRRRIVAAITVGVMAIDCVPAPLELTRTDVPSIYRQLSAVSSDAVVCALPLGVRDGFSSLGAFDQYDLLYQTTHGHPILGGFSARVPHDLRQQYVEAPVIRSLLSLSAGSAIDPADRTLTRAETIDALRRLHIRYVLLNVETAPQELANYVRAQLPLALNGRQDGRELYLVLDH